MATSIFFLNGSNIDRLICVSDSTERAFDDSHHGKVFPGHWKPDDLTLLSYEVHCLHVKVAARMRIVGHSGNERCLLAFECSSLICEDQSVDRGQEGWKSAVVLVFLPACGILVAIAMYWLKSVRS